MQQIDLNWSRIHAACPSDIEFRPEPEDFKVSEVLSFDPSGEGEHLFMHIRKTGLTSDFVADQLARWSGVRKRDVSMAGYKDKQGVTSQWFSIQLPGRDGPEAPFELSGCEVLTITRNSRKLKRGAISANQFIVRLRQADKYQDLLTERFETICTSGVPNYFGPQRFGRDGSNILRAEQLLKSRKGRDARSMIISALRSYLFNLMLSRQVTEGEWKKINTGDPLQLSGNKSWYRSEDPLADTARMEAGDCSPTLPLYSDKDFPETDLDKLIESRRIHEAEHVISVLKAQRLEPARRATVLRPSDARIEWHQEDLILSFSLPTGCYATSLLREMTAAII